MKKSIKMILEPMRPIEKIDYIWQYYKFHIMVGVAVAIMMISILSSVFDKEEVALNITIMGEKVDTEGVYALEEYLNDELLSGNEDSDITIQYVRYDQSSMDGAFGLQKVLADISAGFIDVLIVDKQLFNQLAYEQQLLPINDIKGYEMIDLEKNRPYYSDEKMDGISTSEIRLLKTIDYDGAKILCIPANAENLDFITQLFELFF